MCRFEYHIQTKLFFFPRPIVFLDDIKINFLLYNLSCQFDKEFSESLFHRLNINSSVEAVLLYFPYS